MCYCCNKETSKKKFFIFAKITDKRGRVLSIGFNSYIKTAPLQAKWAVRNKLPKKEFIHAEMMAISRLKYQHLSKVHAIYVYRFDASGRPALAKPCKICQSAIKAANIKHVYYTTPDDALDMDYSRYQEYNDEYYDQWCSE